MAYIYIYIFNFFWTKTLIFFLNLLITGIFYHEKQLKHQIFFIWIFKLLKNSIIITGTKEIQDQSILNKLRYLLFFSHCSSTFSPVFSKYILYLSLLPIFISLIDCLLKKFKDDIKIIRLFLVWREKFWYIKILPLSSLLAYQRQARDRRSIPYDNNACSKIIDIRRICFLFKMAKLPKIS